jgi:small GTP-binding protein
MRQSMLTNEQTQLLIDEKETLSNILLRLAEMDCPQAVLNTLQKATVQLDELFLIVVVGEFNAGKSALINAILGEKILAEGVIPTTTRVTLVKWGETKNEQVVDEAYAVINYPLALLKELNIVDSPGTNAIIRQHERLTDEFVPRCDLVLFTTSADRPLTESERQFLERILAWGKKVVFVLNKADIFEDPAALQQAQDYVLKHATVTLGEIPLLFPVSAKLAQKAMAETDEAERERQRAASHLDDLEDYISTVLDDATRLRLKLKSPLGVAENLVHQIKGNAQKQMDSLAEDAVTANALEMTANAYEHDLELELGPRLAEVENILNKFEMRGLDFFDRTLRLTNIHNLARGDKIRAAFEKEVLNDVSAQIDEQVHKTIDWLVEKDLREWQQVMSYLQRRQTQHLDQIVSGGTSSQEMQRNELVDKVRERIATIIESYDQVKEASHLAASVETAVAQTALIEVGAVGLGALVSTALLSSALDITGMVAAGTLAIVGFFVIPYKRKQAKDDFRNKVVTLRSGLYEALSGSFKHESANAIARLRESITPYTRYVHAEQERILKVQTQLNDLRQSILTLRARIESSVK